MSRRLEPTSEAVALFGAGRALLLQLARPEVGHGVARHSDFSSNPLGRLNGTLMYVYAVMAGTREDREAAARYVSRRHDPVHGPADGDDYDETVPSYDAHDPELQLWVTATLYDTAVTVHDRVLGHPPDAVADRVYSRYAAIGRALDVPEGAWPRDRRAFAVYWEGALDKLRVDATIREQAAALWRAEAAPAWVRALMPLTRFVTAGLLPTAVREGYGMPWSAARQRRFDLFWAVLARVYPVLPTRVRSWPERHFLRRLRRLSGSAS